MVSDPFFPLGTTSADAGLNPCSNGIWSLTKQTMFNSEHCMCLNPCSNGIWSLTELQETRERLCHVLILVLMEYGL